MAPLRGLLKGSGQEVSRVGIKGVLVEAADWHMHVRVQAVKLAEGKKYKDSRTHFIIKANGVEIATITQSEEDSSVYELVPLLSKRKKLIRMRRGY